MKFGDAWQYAHEFWLEPESTPFPADVQDKLIGSNNAGFRHVGAMSVVYNGLLAYDTAYVDAADEILHDIQLDDANTADAIRIARDICYLGLFRAVIDPQLNGNFNTTPKAALKASLDSRLKLADERLFNAGDASGILSEALVVYLLNEAGFETVPSFPWDDQPHGVDGQALNPAFDARVLTAAVTKPKVQVKSSLGMPPRGFCENTSGKWDELDLETRREILVRSYAPDIAVVVLETDLNIPFVHRMNYFRGLIQKGNQSFDTWKLSSMDAITEAVW